MVSQRLVVRDLSYSYTRERVAVDGVTLSASDGHVVFVLGPNGSGKTTLFRLLLGLLRPSFGSIEVAGRPLARLGVRERARELSYIPQQQAGAFNYRVRDVVLMGRTPHVAGLGAVPNTDDEANVADALGVLDIGDLAERGIDELSGGQRQLVLIARALCQESSIVLMDEPTANLDFGNQHRVLREVRRLADRGRLVVVSSHNPADAFGYADSVVLMKHGQVVAHRPVADIDAETLSELYGMSVEVYDVGGAPGRRVAVAGAESTANSLSKEIDV